MTKIYDLKKRIYAYAIDIIKFLRELPKDYISQTIGKQLLRSATSIGANITEGQSASSKKEFVNFYNYSLKSANETKFWLELLKDSGVINIPTMLSSILNETDEIAKIIASSIITLKRNQNF
jgi:four helix bundle protein